MANNATAASYEQLKQQMNDVDAMYSRTVMPVTLDLPETLGLEKLVYNAPSDAELLQRAQEKYRAYYDGKVNVLEQSYADKANAADSELCKAESKYNAACAQIYAEYAEKIKKAQCDCLKKGVFGSSMLAGKIDSLTEERSSKLAAKLAEYQAKKQENEQTKQLLLQNKEVNLANIHAQFEAQANEEYLSLKDSCQKDADTVTRYNNTVDEKETEYQSTRKRSMFNAEISEQRRALQAAQTIGELGLTGVENMKSEEKVDLAKRYFATLPRSEALALFNADSTLSYHFGNYYQYMQEYIQSLPQ
ncbi:MAG: hypothetical protein NC350_03025 [Corallococcus sp.]|nr:hypothetical protein [Corallococcus sp.]